MKTLSRLLLLTALMVGSLSAQRSGGQNPFDGVMTPVGVEKMIAAARAADDERLAATKAGDPVRLDAIFSDELRYAHSSGKVDTKASYMKSLVSRTTVYDSFAYQERNFKLAGPGIVLMTGRVVIHAANDGQPVVNDLNFLAVWREENGRWRFLAWQSCKNPPPASLP